MPRQNDLADYLPEQSVYYINQLLCKYKVAISLHKARKTKLGDFRPANKAHVPRITINDNLNSYTFLIVLLHEIAHLICAEKNKGVKPHGKEWKNIFRNIALPLIDDHIFPKDVEQSLRKYLHAPKATICACRDLYLSLRKYGKQQEHVLLEMLPDNSIFEYNARRFKKVKKIRVRYLCKEVKTGRSYNFSPFAKVHIVEK